MGLTIWDWADYELLHLVDDNEGEYTAFFAQELEVGPQNVGSRFSRMRLHGLLDRTEKGGWTVGKSGRSMLNGGGKDFEALRRLTKQAAKTDGTRWAFTREATRNLKTAPKPKAKA
jgi:hypothetical protein